MKPMQKGIGTIALATGATVLAISLFGGKKAETESINKESTGNAAPMMPVSSQSLEPVIVASTDVASAVEVGSESANQQASQATDSAISSQPVTAANTDVSSAVEVGSESASQQASQSMDHAIGSQPVVAVDSLAPAPEGPFQEQDAGKPIAPTMPKQPVMSAEGVAVPGGISAEAPLAPASPTTTSHENTTAAPIVAGKVPIAPVAPTEMAIDSPSIGSDISTPIPLAPGIVSMGINPKKVMPAGDIQAKPEAPAAVEKPEAMSASQDSAIKETHSGQMQMPRMNMPSTGFQMPQMNMPMGATQGTPRIIYVPVPVYSQQPVNVQPQPVINAPEAAKQTLGQ